MKKAINIAKRHGIITSLLFWILGAVQYERLHSMWHLCQKSPVNAIDLHTLRIQEKKCIRCYACVKGCPKAARKAEFRMKLFGVGFKHLGGKREPNQIIL